ncbi:unnamed protein product [Scytosiphon promiscuus]
MAAAWRNLIVRSDELGLAACGFKSLGERLVALTSGVGVRPLSQAAAAVSEAAKIAASEAQQVLESAQAAEAAAARALTLVAVAPNADRVADPVVARCREKATGVEGLPEVGVATAAPAEASARAVAQALERATKPSLTVDSMHTPARRQAAHSGDGDINTSGRSSSKRDTVDHTAVGVIVKTDGSIPGDQKDLTTQPKCGGGTKATSVSQGRRERFEILAGRSIEENHDEGEEHEALNESDQIQEDVDMDGKRRGNDERQSKRKSLRGQNWHGIDSGQQSPESRRPKRRRMATSALATGGGGNSSGLASRRHGTLNLGRRSPFSRDSPSSGNRGPAEHQRHRMCFSRDCTKRPPSGAVGSKEKVFCTAHDFAGTADVRAEQRCGHADCTRRPSHGLDVSREAEFRFLQAVGGTSNVFQTRCRHRGCVKAEYCATHAPAGMANVVSKRCGHPECSKGPSYGADGSKKAEFCAQHATVGMTNVVSKRCGHPECSKVLSARDAAAQSAARDHHTAWLARRRPSSVHNTRQ